MTAITFVRDSDPEEFRSLIFPDQVHDIVRQGVDVVCEAGIGAGYGIADAEFEAAGASVRPGDRAWGEAELVAKYKPVAPADVPRMPEGCTYASYLHLEDNPELADSFRRRRVRAVAFEFVEEPEGQFPVTRGHSEIAGKMAVIYGAYHLQWHLGGNGIFLASVPDVAPARVLVIGYGNSGAAAARTAAALGADVTVLGRNPSRLRAFAASVPGNVTCEIYDPDRLRDLLPTMDLVIGAILISTYDTSPVITQEMVASMKTGSMIVDVSCGYGPGYLETFDRNSTLADPVYERFGVLHCKIDKLPGGVPVTSARSLSQLCHPYLVRLAKDLERAKEQDREAPRDPALRRAVVTDGGRIVRADVAEMLEKRRSMAST